MTAVKTLRACVSLFRVRFAEGLQYRTAAFSSLLISVFWSIIECVLYTVFFTYSQYGGQNSNGMSLSQTISYVWLAQGLFVLQSMSIDGDIMKKIISGDVGVELCRPLDLYSHWFAKSAAGKLGGGWIRLVFTFLAGFLMPAGYALGMPASLAGLVMFLFSTAMAFLLCSSFGMLITAIRVNITWGDGPTYMLMLVSGVLSGVYLPLRLWPDWLQSFLRLQPFAGFTDTPVQLYIGSLSPTDALPSVVLQLLWSLTFILLGRLVLKRRLKTVIVQGG